MVERSLSQCNISIDDLNVVAYIENTETIKQCVKKGLGVTFISHKAIASDIENGTIKSNHWLITYQSGYGRDQRARSVKNDK